MEILRTEGLYKTYNEGTDLEVRALKPLDLSIEKGVFYAIIGRSGSGKSTLLQILGGLDRPTGGKLFIEDADVFGLSNSALCKLRRRRIGFVFQAYNLLDEHTVKENILMPLHLDGREADPAFLRELVDALESTDKLDRYPDQLSGGEQQRVAIARALVNNPDTIVADEPTGNLDPSRSLEIMSLLERINALGTTVVVVTHEKSLVNRFEKRVIMINEGNVVTDSARSYEVHEVQNEA